MQEVSSTGSSGSSGGAEDEGGGSRQAERAVTPFRSTAARFTFAHTGEQSTPSSSSSPPSLLSSSSTAQLLSSAPSTTSPIVTSASSAAFPPMSPPLVPRAPSPPSELHTARPPSTPRRLPASSLPSAAPQTSPTALVSSTKTAPSIVSPIRPISTHPPPSPGSVHSISGVAVSSLSRFAPIAPFVRPSPLATWLPAPQSSAFTPSSAFHQLSIVSPSHTAHIAPTVPPVSRKRAREQGERPLREEGEEGSGTAAAAASSTAASIASTPAPSPLSSQRSSLVSTASSVSRTSSRHSHTLSGSSFGSLTSSPPLQLSEESSPLSSTLASPQLRPSLLSSQPDSLLSTPHLLTYAPPVSLSSTPLSISASASLSSSPSLLPTASSAGLLPSAVSQGGGHEEDSELSEEEDEEEAEYGADTDDDDMKIQQRALPASSTSASPPLTPLTSTPRSATSATAATSSTSRRKRARPSAAIVAHFSSIECGKLDSNNVRIFYDMSAYFGKEMEIYTATIDPHKRVLYRASVLADKFGCATNKVGMYLARRRQASDGLYQATNFLFKPMGRTGLKSGGYFLSLEMCKAFERHFIKQTSRKRMRHQGEVMMNLMKMGLLNAAVPAAQAATMPMTALSGGGLAAAQQQAAMTAQLQMHMQQEFAQQMMAAAAHQQQQQRQQQQQQQQQQHQQHQQQQASMLSLPFHLMSSQGASQPFLRPMAGHSLSASTLSAVAEEGGGLGSLSNSQLQQLHQAGLLQPNMLHNPPPPSLPPSTLLNLGGRPHSASQLISSSSASLPPFPHPNVALLSPSQAGLLSSLPSGQQLPVAPLVPQSPSASVVPLAAPTPRPFSSVRGSPAPRAGHVSALSGGGSIGSSASFPYSSLSPPVFPTAVPPSPRYLTGVAPLSAAVMSAMPAAVSLSAPSNPTGASAAPHMLSSAAASVGTPPPPSMSAQSHSPLLSTAVHKPPTAGAVKRSSPSPRPHAPPPH